MSDTNYPPLDFSDVHGTPDNPIQVRVVADPIFYTISGHPNPAWNGRFPHPAGIPPIHSDTLKMSNCSWLQVTIVGRLIGGLEDCFDCNNLSHDIIVTADEWESGGKYVCTIKGGSYNIRVNGKIVKHGTETDVDLGNWSDQSRERTRDVVINMTADAPIQIRVLNAWEPVLSNKVVQAYVRNDFWKGIFLFFYTILKKFGYG